MSRITKQIAEFVAEKMSAEKKQNLLIKKKELEVFVISEYMESVPKKIKEAFSKAEDKDYIISTSSIQFGGVHGLGFNYIKLGKRVPIRNIDRAFCPSKYAAKKIVSLERECKDLEKKYKEVHEGVYQALIGLKTYNNVEKEFPEAFEFLPAIEKSTAIMLNIDSLRQKLK